MKVIQGFGPKDLRLVEAPEPHPGEGQVLVAVRANGICGSDKGYYIKGTVGRVAGHEVAGEVVSLGPGIRRLRVGDHVAINNVVGCGHCAACRAGEFVLCPTRPGKDIFSGYGELLVAPESNCLQLSSRISFDAGCLIIDNWGTPFSALERAKVAPGDDVLVSGCGPIGLATVALAKQRGAYVIAVDPLQYRLDAATRLGADAVLKPGDAVPLAAHDLTSGAGVRVVMECSGKTPAYQPALESLRLGGTFVAIGEGAQFDFRPSDLLIRNHLTIMGSWYSTMRQAQLIQDLVLQGQIDATAFVSHRIPLSALPQFFATVCSFEDNVLKAIVLMPPSSGI